MIIGTKKNLSLKEIFFFWDGNKRSKKKEKRGRCCPSQIIDRFKSINTVRMVTHQFAGPSHAVRHTHSDNYISPAIPSLVYNTQELKIGLREVILVRLCWVEILIF